jgi:hypothetical protein
MTEFIVVEILPTDILLGINALKQMNAVIHCAKGELLIDNKKVNCTFKKRTEFENEYKALFCIFGSYKSHFKQIDTQKSGECKSIAINVINFGSNCKTSESVSNSVLIDFIGNKNDEKHILNTSQNKIKEMTSFNEMSAHTGGSHKEKEGYPIVRYKFDSNGVQMFKPLNLGQIHAFNDFAVTPLSVCSVKVKVSHGKRFIGQTILMYSTDVHYLRNGLSLINAISNVPNKVIYAQIINVSERSVDIKEGKVLGVFELIDNKNIFEYCKAIFQQYLSFPDVRYW